MILRASSSGNSPATIRSAMLLSTVAMFVLLLKCAHESPGVRKEGECFRTRSLGCCLLLDAARHSHIFRADTGCHRLGYALTLGFLTGRAAFRRSVDRRRVLGAFQLREEVFNTRGLLRDSQF